MRYIDAIADIESFKMERVGAGTNRKMLLGAVLVDKVLPSPEPFCPRDLFIV